MCVCFQNSMYTQAGCMCTTMNKPNSIFVPVPINTVHYSINRIIYKSTNNCIYIYINIYIYIYL